VKRFTTSEQETGVKVRQPTTQRADTKPERIQWKRTNGRNELLLDKVYDAVTEEFSREAMASLATVLAHICIISDVAKPKAIEAFGSVYDETRDKLSGSCANAFLLN
jgi:hypothetical protein